jgi:cell wall-associated NlpC family hydrolase
MAALQQQITQTGAVLDQLAETYDAATVRLSALQQDEASVRAKVVVTQRHLAATRVRLRAEALISYMGDITATDTNTLFSPGTSEATREYEQVAVGNTSAAIAAFEIQTGALAAEETSLQATEAQINANLDQIATARQSAMAAASAQQAALAALSSGNDPATPAFLAAQSSGRDALVADRSATSALPHALVVAMWAAASQVGVPYVWGGETPLPGPGAGFDCSGLVQWSYGQAGISLPRTAQEQHDAITAVPAAQVQPGDLVFWNDGTTSVQHVAIYVGAGVVLEAPSTGSVVSYSVLWADGLVGFGDPTVPSS